MKVVSYVCREGEDLKFLYVDGDFDSSKFLSCVKELMKSRKGRACCETIITDFGPNAEELFKANGYTHVTYNVVFENGEGEELFVYEWKVPRLLLMNVDVNDYEAYDWTGQGCSFYNAKSSVSHVMRFYASPFVGCAAQTLIQWRDVLIDEVILREVKNIKIELAQ